MKKYNDTLFQTHERIAWIDVAKGIGILLVVLGHNHYMKKDLPLRNIIYSFHMPLFFLISGFFIKPEKKLFYNFKKKFTSLIKPYLSALAIAALIQLILNHKLPLLNYAINGLYGGINNVPWGPLWFLPHLFLVIMIFCFLRKLSNTLKINEAHFLLLTTILFISNIIFIGYFWKKNIFPQSYENGIMYGLPWSMDIAFISMYYFYIGYILYKKGNLILYSKFFSIFAPVALLIIYFHPDDFSLELAARTYDSIIYTTPVTFILIALTLTACNFISKHQNFFSQSITYIGENSLIILIFHDPIQIHTYNFIYSHFHGNQSYVLSSLLSFLSGVIVPLFLKELFLKRNRLTAWAFSIVRA